MSDSVPYSAMFQHHGHSTDLNQLILVLDDGLSNDLIRSERKSRATDHQRDESEHNRDQQSEGCFRASVEMESLSHGGSLR